MATFNKFNAFVAALASKLHNLGSDTLKIALTNTAPTAANAVLSDITQISGGGYTAGGNTATVTSSAQSAGVYKLVLADVVFTATGTMGPFRYAVLYNSTPAAGNLIGWWDYGTGGVTLATGETFTVDADPSTGVLTLA